MHRREFLRQGSVIAAGLPLLSACSHLVPASQEGGGRLWPELIAELEKQIPHWIEGSKVPGLSIAVIEDAKIAWHRGFGVKDAWSNEPVDENTIFEAASTSKPVFAYSVMKLCEKGALDLDTPLTHYTRDT